MSSWHSPQKIYSVGHRAVKDLFDREVQVQEKIDGSFFAFGSYLEPFIGQDFTYDGYYPDLKVRSKGAMMIPDAPEGMFKLAVQTVKVLFERGKLHPGWQYRGEVLAKPKHNSLAYDRTPKGNVILFDILTDEEAYVDYRTLKAEGDRLGLEVVPQLYVGKISTAQEFRQFLVTTSVLGGQKIEGVVVKPIEPIYGEDKKLLMAKFVSEEFKEVHRQAWKDSNPKSGDILERLAGMFGTPQRWNKAIIHAREQGQLEGSPRDIGLLIKAIPEDVLAECKDEIMEVIWNWAWPHIKRGVTRGFPEYYKEQLIRQQFEVDGIGSSEPISEGIIGVTNAAAPSVAGLREQVEDK